VQRVSMSGKEEVKLLWYSSSLVGLSPQVTN
jgi:hypothetical protein